MRRMLAAAFVLVFIFTVWPTSEPVAAMGPAAPRGGPGSGGAVAVHATDGDGGRDLDTIIDVIPTAEGCIAHYLRWGLAGT